MLKKSNKGLIITAFRRLLCSDQQAAWGAADPHLKPTTDNRNPEPP